MSINSVHKANERISHTGTESSQAMAGRRQETPAPATGQEMTDELPSKSLKQLVQDGIITKEKLRSMLYLAQTGMMFSGSPEDAIFIAEQLEKMKNGEEIGE